jgi:protocatechuate 3,4-dioxygenase beta subunit
MKVTVFLFAFTTAIFFSSCSKNEQITTQTNHNNGTIAMQESFDLTETYCDEGEDEDPQPMLSGGVTDSVGNDLYRACVEIQTTGGSPVSIIGTDSSGHYFFNSVSNGSYSLKVSYPEYTPKITPFTVSGTPQTINVVLD